MVGSGKHVSELVVRDRVSNCHSATVATNSGFSIRSANVERLTPNHRNDRVLLTGRYLLAEGLLLV